MLLKTLVVTNGVTIERICPRKCLHARHYVEAHFEDCAHNENTKKFTKMSVIYMYMYACTRYWNFCNFTPGLTTATNTKFNNQTNRHTIHVYTVQLLTSTFTKNYSKKIHQCTKIEHKVFPHHNRDGDVESRDVEHQKSKIGQGKKENEEPGNALEGMPGAAPPISTR